jgi:hypothetical protein
MFEALSAKPVMLAVAPSVAIRLRVTCDSLVHAMVVSARIRVDAWRRSFSAAEQARLAPLFGDASQWARSTRVPVPWAEIGVATGRFEGSTEIELKVPCSYDLALATTKLFDAVDGGPLPLSIVFSGTIFAEGEGGLVVRPVPSDEEARVDLSAASFREMMLAYHPEGALVTLPRELRDRIRACKSALSLERSIEELVRAEEARR